MKSRLRAHAAVIRIKHGALESMNTNISCDESSKRKNVKINIRHRISTRERERESNNEKIEIEKQLSRIKYK